MTQLQAILCAVAAFFGWVAVDTAIKLASERSLSPFLIIAILGITAVIGILVSAAYKRDFSVLRPKSWREQIIIGFCALFSFYANVIALKNLPLTHFYIVVFTAPLVISPLSAFLKHEKLTKTKIACLLVGFIGVVIAVGPQLAVSPTETLGIIAALASTVGFAGYTVTIRKISDTDSTESILFLNNIMVGLCGLALASVETMPAFKMGTVVMMLVASVINLLSMSLYNYSLKFTASSNVAQTQYTQIISGAILAYFIWHELPTWNLAIGSVLIIGSGVVVAHQAHRNEIKP